MTLAFSPDRILQEVIFKATTSGGKGGQNVNKVATKIELYFDVSNSTGFNEDQKILIHAKLYNRINGDGILRITSSESRTQLENKEQAKAKFLNLIIKALTPAKKRKQTAPSKSSVEKRLRKKKIKGERKSFRASKETSGDY